jgi:cobalt/nickel transport system permease protein
MHHAHIDRFAYQDSPIHRLDSRVKLIIVLVFTGLVVSLPKASVAVPLCYGLGPFIMLVLANIPLRFVIKHILLICPFILVLALSCVLYDRIPTTVRFGPFLWNMSCGWLRCFAIIMKYMVSMLALITLISTTPFGDLLVGLQRLKVPSPLIIQLGFLYRYIFVVIDSAHHMLRARNTRKIRFLGWKMEIRVAGSMVGALLMRSLDTAERISQAMQARGFSGRWHTLSDARIGRGDWIFSLLAVMYMLGLRLIFRPYSA